MLATHLRFFTCIIVFSSRSHKGGTIRPQANHSESQKSDDFQTLSETSMAQIQQPHKEHVQEGRRGERKVGGRQEGIDQSHSQ